MLTDVRRRGVVGCKCPAFSVTCQIQQQVTLFTDILICVSLFPMGSGTVESDSKLKKLAVAVKPQVRAPQAGELSGKVDAEGKEYEDYKEGET
jgi:hypothetical protein